MVLSRAVWLSQPIVYLECYGELKNGVMLEETWRNTGERLVRNLGVSGRFVVEKG
jgi:hypothetical protein